MPADRAHRAEALAVVAGASAISDPLTCQVWVRPGLTAYGFCVALAHEYGHLAGHLGDAADDPMHSADPRAVMHTTPPRDWAPCVALALPPHVKRVLLRGAYVSRPWLRWRDVMRGRHARLPAHRETERSLGRKELRRAPSFPPRRR